MSRKRYSPESIIGMLREAEVCLAQGMTVGLICRQLSISEQTYYRWRKQYGGLKISQAKRMKDTKLVTRLTFIIPWQPSHLKESIRFRCNLRIKVCWLSDPASRQVWLYRGLIGV